MNRDKIISGIKIGIGAIVLIIIFGYAYAKAEPFLRGPVITILSPRDGVMVNVPLSFIDAKIKRGVRVTFNGRIVHTDERGIVHEAFVFSPGLNTLEITAEDKFKRITREMVTVWYAL